MKKSFYKKCLICKIGFIPSHRKTKFCIDCLLPGWIIGREKRKLLWEALSIKYVPGFREMKNHSHNEWANKNREKVREYNRKWMQKSRKKKKAVRQKRKKRPLLN